MLHARPATLHLRLRRCFDLALGAAMAGFLALVLPAGAHAQILSITSNPVTGAPITYQPTNMEGATISVPDSPCTGCVIANTPASAAGTYNFALAAFGMLPVYSSIPNTSPPPAGVYSEIFEGDCSPLSLSGGLGTLLAGSCQTFTIFAQPGSSNAVFQFELSSAAGSTVVALPGTTTYLILFGTTAAPVATTTTPLCGNANPPPVGCVPFASDVTTSFNAITLDWYGYLSTTPYAAPAPGSNTVTLFNLTGLTQAEATNILTNQGLTTSVVFVSSSSVPEGSVISQSPSALSSVQTGSTVTIYVSSGPPAISDQIPNQGITAVNTNPLDPNLYVAVSRTANYVSVNDIVVYSSANDTVAANIALPAASNTPANMVIDSVNNVIYVAGTNGSSAGSVTVIDGLTHTINAVLTVGRSPEGIAVDPTLNLAYVANSDDTFISVIQGPTRSNSGAITANAKVVASVGGILPLGAIAVDTNNNTTTDPYSHTVYAIIDGAAPLGELNYTLAVITGNVNAGYSVAQVSYLPYSESTDIGGNALAVDQTSGHVVIADTEDQFVHIYNPNGGGLQSLYEGFYPDTVKIDSTHELAYVSSAEIGNVVQINLLTGTQTTVASAPAASCGTSVALDPGTDVAYFTVCNGAAGLGVNGSSINAWDGAANLLNWSSALGSPLGNYGYYSGAFGISVNPTSHVVYVSSSTTTIPATANTPAILGAIDVINGPTPGPSPQFKVSVSGTTPPIATEALNALSTVGFGGVADATQSPPATFTITNASTAAATLLPTVSGAGFAAASDNCQGTPVVAGGSCQVALVFTPSTSVAYQGSVAFLDTERDTPQVIALTGTGTGTYPLTITPSTIPEGYVGLPYTPTSYPLYFTSPNAANAVTFNICATVGGLPSTNPADCCPPSSYDSGLPPSGSCPAGLLPTGMNWAYGNLSAASGLITTAGSYPFSVVATDENGDTGFQNYTLVIGPPFTASLALSSNTVIGGASVTATVTLNQPAPAGGALVFIDSNNTTVVPSTIVEIPAGGTTATATVATNGVAALTPVGLYSYYSVAGVTLTLTVEPPGGGSPPPPPPPPSVAVPTVDNLTAAAAESALTTAGLVYTTTTQTSTTVASGYVITSSPVAGTKVADGSSVALTLSSGPPTVAVPTVDNLTTAAAESALTTAGLVYTTTAQTSTTVALGYVITSSPVAGTNVADGSSVALTISSGAPTVTVPTVDNLTAASAESALTGVGLVYTTTTQTSTTVASGYVITSSPVAGTKVADGSSVALTLSSGPPTVAVPTVDNLTTAAAESALTTAGLVYTTTSQTSTSVASGYVITSSPTAGTMVADGASVTLTISSGAPAIAIGFAGTPVVTSTAAGWSVTITLQNTGNVTAQTVQETSATLNGVAQLAAPASITIAPGATGSIVLTFPSSAGTASTSVHFAVSGTYSGTTLSGNWAASLRAVALP